MRKIIMLSLAAAAIAGAGGVAYAQADPQAGPRGERGPPATRVEAEQRSAAAFARMDANHDGKIDPADRAVRLQDRQRQAFDRLDADRSDAISFEELSAGREQRGEARAERGRPDGQHFGRRGRGGPDGPRFGRGGRGGQGGQGGPGMARAADTDNDGAVTQAEFASVALARFDRLDANRDGTISADERPQPRRMMRRERRQRDAG